MVHLMNHRHKWEKQEYRDNQHELIEIFWCPECGSIKKKITMAGVGPTESVKTPKWFSSTN